MASQGNILHSEYAEPGGISQLAGYGVRRAGTIGLLTNAQVVSATSAEDLEAIVEAALLATVHEEYSVQQLMVDRSLKFGDAIGDFTDARVAAATSVEDLAEKTAAGDESDLVHQGVEIL